MSLGRITSVFMYVEDLLRSVDFYHDIFGAEVRELIAEDEQGPYTLAILQLGSFTLMLHPQIQSEGEHGGGSGVGLHLQFEVPNIDEFYQHCLDQGAFLSLSGEPVNQEWGWREMALRDPDGYIWSVYEDRTQGRWTAGPNSARVATPSISTNVIR